MKNVALLLISISLFACTAKKKVPSGVLPIPKMSVVMWQVMQADAVVSRRYVVDTSFKKFDTSLLLYGQIFATQKTSADQFKKSMRFYESRPDLLQVLLDSLQHRADAAILPAADSAKPQ